MSLFAAYFEKANHNSTNYSNFKEVGKFTIPQEIFGGTKEIIENNTRHTACIITDITKQCVNNFFLKNGSLERTLMTKFLTKRLENDCITPCIVFYIEDESDSIQTKNIRKFKANMLDELFLSHPIPGELIIIER